MTSPVLLKCRDLEYAFPVNGIPVLKGVSLDLRQGEVLGIMGENGAGKSTLMFLLSGIFPPGGGNIYIPGGGSGKGTAALQRLCGMVHQKPLFSNNLSALENIILDGCGFLVRTRQVEREIRGIQEKYGLPLDLKLRGRDLAASGIQRCELIRALWRGKRVIILDEPTAGLSERQSRELFRLMATLKKEGRGILFISHKIPEVMHTADRIGVLCRGKLLAVRDTKDYDPRELSALMVGPGGLKKDEAPLLFPGFSSRKIVLELRDVAFGEGGSPGVEGISFKVARGEILGIGGIREKGLDILEDLLAGIRQPQGGSILFKGRKIQPLTPYRLRKMGITYIPAQRLTRGSSPESSIAENLSILRPRIPWGDYRRGLLKWAGDIIRNQRIAGEAEQKVKTLSGGNVQKMIAARELMGQPALIIVSEPSWGLDLKSRERLHRQLVETAGRGSGILVLSTDLDELLLLSRRIAILGRGTLRPVKNCPEERNRFHLGEMMTGAGESLL